MSECNCKDCIQACERYPGWMTVDEAKAVIVAGLGNRLMLDYWAADPDVFVLCPAIQGIEGESAPFWPNGPCTFLKDGLCEIHTSGFKPLMCREVRVCKDEGPSKSDFLQYWDTQEGRDLVAAWENRDD